jgi:penicillin-insensitive murein endopeptidase
MGVGWASLALAILALGSAVAGTSEPEWGNVPDASPPPARAIGSPARGCLAGAVALPAEGRDYHVMRPSRGRFYGHSVLIRFIRSLAEAVRNEGRQGLLVGDLAQPRGGPMSSGHRSHQTGLDADIWFRPAPRQPLATKERETLQAISVVGEDAEAVDRSRWSAAHVRLLRTAAGFPEVARIFVNPAIKRELCAVADTDRRWLNKIRPWWGHDAHFHVRLRCPEEGGACVDQTPPPPGDGCDETLTWWFSEKAEKERLKRSREPPPRRLTLDDLPPECRSVLSAP